MKTTVYRDFYDKRRRVNAGQEAVDILHLLLEATDRLCKIKNAATGDLFSQSETFSQVYRDINTAYAGVYELGKEFGYEIDYKVWKYPSRTVVITNKKSVAE